VASRTMARRPRGPGGRGAAGRGGRARGRRLRWPRSRRKPVLVVVAAAALAALAGWVLLGSSLVVVRSVRVTGTGPALSAAQVTSAAHVAHGQPLISVNTGAIARRVERLAPVRSVGVSRDWPSTIVIAVQLRRPVFMLAVGGGYALVDASGAVIRDVPARPAGLPLLTLSADARALRGSPAVRAAAAVLAELPRRIARKARGVTAGGPNDVSVTLANGAVIVWGGPGRAALKARELDVLMQRHARVYDVSGAGTAVTKG
jgi:cell division protein FtsQ